MCGKLMDSHKVLGLSGTGSPKRHKVFSRMGELLEEVECPFTFEDFKYLDKIPA